MRDGLRGCLQAKIRTTIEGFVAQSDRMFSEVKIGVFGIRMCGREVILYLTGGRLHESNSVSGRLRPAYQVPRA